MNEPSRMSGFITQGRPGGFGDEQDSMNDKQSEPCQTSHAASLRLSCCLAEDSVSQLPGLFACLILCLQPFQLPPTHHPHRLSAPFFALKLNFSSSWPHNWKGGILHLGVPVPLNQTGWRKTAYVSGTKPTDPVLSAREKTLSSIYLVLRDLTDLFKDAEREKEQATSETRSAKRGLNNTV